MGHILFLGWLGLLADLLSLCWYTLTEKIMDKGPRMKGNFIDRHKVTRTIKGKEIVLFPRSIPSRICQKKLPRKHYWKTFFLMNFGLTAPNLLHDADNMNWHNQASYTAMLLASIERIFTQLHWFFRCGTYKILWYIFNW